MIIQINIDKILKIWIIKYDTKIMSKDKHFFDWNTKEENTNMKNMKKMFFVLTLLTLLLAVTTVSAADDNTTNVVSQAPTVVQDAVMM